MLNIYKCFAEVFCPSDYQTDAIARSSIPVLSRIDPDYLFYNI